MLDAVARDLAEVLDHKDLPRDLRPEARRLLMEAWLVLGRPRRVRAARGAHLLARRLDALVAAVRTGVPPTPLPRADRLGIADRLLPPRAAPLEERLVALEGSVAALARRTFRMVEQAESAARKAGILPATAGPVPVEGGRADLELVWGDDLAPPGGTR